MAFRHTCPNADRSGSLKCPGGDGKPGKGPKKCPGCGAALLVETGCYGVFPYDPENRRYTREALGTLENQRTFLQREAAARLADRLTEGEAAYLLRTGQSPGRGYVVRWIRDRLLPVSPGR